MVFMQSVDSFPCSRQPDTFPLLSPVNAVHNLTHYSFKIHFNIILRENKLKCICFIFFSPFLHSFSFLLPLIFCFFSSSSLFSPYILLPLLSSESLFPFSAFTSFSSCLLSPSCPSHFPFLLLLVPNSTNTCSGREMDKITYVPGAQSSQACFPE